MSSLAFVMWVGAFAGVIIRFTPLEQNKTANNLITFATAVTVTYLALYL